MSFSIVPIINSIPNIEAYSYLELGVWNGRNHSKILCRDKSSVDVGWNPTFKMTTDEFFAQNKEKWDIVFVDADHNLEGGLKDYNNSTKICSKFIIMHDLYPDNPQQATETGNYAGNVWRLLYHIISRKIHLEHYVLNGDVGMTVFFPPFKTFDLKDIDKTVSYSQLDQLAICRYSIAGMQDILRKRL